MIGCLTETTTCVVAKPLVNMKLICVHIYSDTQIKFSTKSLGSIDAKIGKILQMLKETGQYENTVIVFISDNGANRHGNNGDLRGFKASVYEGGTRVPAIITYPEKIKGGKVNDQVVLTMDLFPTLLDFIGQKPEAASIDGISIKENLFHQRKLPQRDVFFAYNNVSFIRSNEWKLIRKKRKKGDVLEFYNLSIDLQERTDLSLDSTDLVNEMIVKLNDWEKDVKGNVKVLSK